MTNNLSYFCFIGLWKKNIFELLKSKFEVGPWMCLGPSVLKLAPSPPQFFQVNLVKILFVFFFLMENAKNYRIFGCS